MWGMTQKLAWPAEPARQENGSVLVSFPDLPEALTEALTQAKDGLIAALGGCVETWRAIPRPSPAQGRTMNLSAGTRRRQDRTSSRDADRGCWKHCTGRAARRFRRRGAMSDRPRPPFAHRPDQNGDPFARTASGGRDTVNMGSGETIAISCHSDGSSNRTTPHCHVKARLPL